MAESPKNRAERHESLPPVDHLLPTPEQAEPLRRGEKDPVEALEQARAAIEETTHDEAQLDPLEQLQVSENAAKPPAPSHVNRELRSVTLNRELKLIRQRLNRPGRVLSRVVHQPVVRAISEPAGKTAGRPSGLLGGSVVAFLGSTGYLYLAEHGGMHYNYSAFLALFAGGFVIGLGLELLIRVAASSRHRAAN